MLAYIEVKPFRRSTDDIGLLVNKLLERVFFCTSGQVIVAQGLLGSQLLNLQQQQKPKQTNMN